MHKNKVTISQSYLPLVYMLIGLFSIVLLGFFNTYFIFFPQFESFRFAHHFHGFFMVLWLLMLIVQPWLISRGHFKSHRVIGRSSYVIAPLVALSIFMIARHGYYHPPEPDMPEIVKLGMQALSLPNLFAFSILYVLAISNTDNTPEHLRYMIGTALLMLGPGLGRVLVSFFGMAFPAPVIPVKCVELALAGTLLTYDIKMKNPLRPAIIITSIITVTTLLWILRFTMIWQGFARIFTDLFY
jgi:hypothetical protein